MLGGFIWRSFNPPYDGEHGFLRLVSPFGKGLCRSRAESQTAG